MDHYQNFQEDENNFIPCKLPLCMICVSPTNSDPLDSEEKEGDHEVTISKETFLKGITILCNNLSLEDTFGREEEWTKVLGTRGNFVGSVSCGRCCQLLNSLVELHDLIVRTEVKLKEHVNQVELSVVNSLGLAAEAEYSISTCLRFREEVFKSFQKRSCPAAKFDPDIDITFSRTRKRNPNKVKAGPLCVKLRREAKLKEEALVRVAEVKVEKLTSSSLRAQQGPSSTENEDVGVDSNPPTPVEFSFENEDERPEVVNGFLETDRKRRRGRPPKLKQLALRSPLTSPKRRGRPRKQAKDDDGEYTIIPNQKRKRGRPSKRSTNQEFQSSPISKDSKVAKGMSRSPKRSHSTEVRRSKSVDNYDNDQNYSPESDSDFPSEPEPEDSDPLFEEEIKTPRKRSTSHTGPKSRRKSSPDRRLTRIDDPFNDRRTCSKVEKLLCEDGTHYLRPFLVLSRTEGVLSFSSCKILLEHERLICKHPDCDFQIKFKNFPISNFYAFRTMRLHVKTEHRRTPRPGEDDGYKKFFHCPFCYCLTGQDNLFEKRFFLIEHIKSEHSSTAAPYPALCEVCGCSVPYEELVEHVITHKNDREKEIAREGFARDTSTSTSASQSQSQLRRGPKKDPLLPLEFPCDECDLCFEEYTRYRLHSQSHVPVELRKQFQCDMCPEKFCSTGILNIHIKTVHLREEQPKPYECNICGEKFIQVERRRYEIHMRLHTGELPFQCAECGKGFRQKSRLNKHERLVHLGFRMDIQCEYCPNIYKSRKYLRNHHRKHHAELMPEKPPVKTRGLKIEELPDFHGPKLMYPCEPCGKVYTYKSQLVPHLKHAHKMMFPSSSDYPNMITLEDNLEFMKGRNRKSSLGSEKNQF